eukprot:TRINITY_DN5742_c0_g3_i2.p1 TRINITY_DN5742_c0_g3~~TRINITY_DN5742_c0_g3_i2.p1  ORF type:complete len:731 (-),score=151.56 TRINITY_DN5742_c0_g3_i2:128-2320(-)
MAEDVCFNCGLAGHWASNCPQPQRAKAPPIDKNPFARIISSGISSKANPANSAKVDVSSANSEAQMKQSTEQRESSDSDSQGSSKWSRLKIKIQAVQALRSPSSEKVSVSRSGSKEELSSQAHGPTSKLINAEQQGNRRDVRRATLAKPNDAKKADIEMTQASLRDILTKQPEERTHDDLAFLREITKSLKFFHQMAIDLHVDLCKVMRYEEVKSGNPVFYQGSIGKTFYVVLSGSVTVHVKSTDEEEKQDEQEQPDGAKQGEKPVDLGRMVATIYSGESFGELALLKSTAAPRAASIVAAEDAEFLTIHKTDYDKTLKKMQIQALENKLLFLRTFSFFRNWELKRLTRFSHFMKNVVYNSAETIIVKQGQISDHVYLIYKGQCRVVYLADVGRSHHASSVPTTSYVEQDVADDDLFETDGDGKWDDDYEAPSEAEVRDFHAIENCEVLSQDICKPKFRTFYTRPMTSHMRAQRHKMKVDLAVLCPGEMFGEGGLLCSAPQLATVIADNNTELIVINKTDFMKRMDDRSKGIVKSIWEMKNDWLQEHLDVITRMNPHGRPGHMFFTPSQPSTPKSGSLTSRRLKDLPPLPDEIAEAMKHKIKRPRPPSQERCSQLATPRHRMPSSRQRRQMLEELAVKLAEHEQAIFVQRHMQSEKPKPPKPMRTAAPQPAIMAKARARAEEASGPSVVSFESLVPIRSTKPSSMRNDPTTTSLSRFDRFTIATQEEEEF